jgi:predicted metal-dependent peptidase
MNTQNGTRLKLTRARTHLLLNQPFFGTLCLRLALVESHVPAMATDGRQIVYNPEFVESLKAAELEAVLAHEVMHCALGHQCRRGDREPRLWNEAADFAINPILTANGFTLPEGALFDPAFENLSAEEIYSRLSRQGRGGGKKPSGRDPQPGNAIAGDGGHESGQSQEKNGTRIEQETTGIAGTGCLRAGPEAFGEVGDATDESGKAASQAERTRQRQEWNIAVDQALRSSQACGRVPLQLDRTIGERREGKLDWRSILREFVAATAPADYQWTPPNRRHIASGLYLPSVIRSGVGIIVIAVDTSGSVGSEALQQFAGEISAIISDAQPEMSHVVYCDAAIQSVQEFGPFEPISLKPMGGGGTDFRPVFHWVGEKRIDPACLIYLTDLCCYSYPEAPNYPVLWVTDSRGKAPFGETLQISGE